MLFRSDAGEVEEWRKRDPITRFRRYLEARKLWNEDREEKLKNEVTAEIEAAVELAEKLPPPKAEDVFRYMFAEMTPQLREQETMLREALRSEKR